MKTRTSNLIAIAAVLCIPLTAKAAFPGLTNFTLAWNPVANAATYTLFWGTASRTYTSSNAFSASQTGGAVSNVLGTQFYYFAVNAADGGGNQSSYSAEVVYAPPPGVLSVSSQSAGASTANAVWGSVGGASTYTLYWGLQSGAYLFSQACTAPQTNLVVSGLVANQVYYFAVSSSDGNGNQSGYSPEVIYTNTSVQQTAPVAPAGLVVAGPPAGGPTATATWGPVSNAASYQLRWGTFSHNYSFNNSGPSSQVSLAASGLQTNTVYYFAVGCTGSNGLQSPLSSEVVYSNAIAATTTTNSPTNSNAPTVTLASPLNLLALPGTNNGVPGVALTWSAVANAASYSLYWGTNSESYLWSDNTASAQIFETNLVGGEVYYFAVMAVGGAGTNSSGFSAEVVYTNTLESPTNFTASTVTNGVALAAWNPVAGAASYTVFYGPQSGVYAASASCPSADTNLTLTNFAGDNVYYLAVAALATNGSQSPYSIEAIYTNVVVVVVSAAAPPTNNVQPLTSGPAVLSPLAVGVSPGASNSAVVTWGATNVASSYQLYWGTGTTNNPNLSTSVVTSQTNVTVNNLAPNGTYVFIVYALDANFQQITWGNMVGYTNVYVPPPVPAPPGGLAVASGTAANCATASWSAVPNVAGYELYWGTASGAYTISNNCPNSQTAVSLSGLVTNQSYYFAVAALGTNGTQSASSSEVAYFNAAPPSANFPPSTNQIPGIPPILGICCPNQQPNLVIAGTVGAQMLIQATTNLCNPSAWTTIDTVLLTNAATGSNVTSTNALPTILQAAFVPALQVYSPSPSNAAAPGQFYRVTMGTDYATLAYQVLPLTNYPTRLIGVLMPGLSQNLCYVTNQYNYIYCDSQSFNIDVQASGPTIRQIATSFAGVLNQNWTSAVELSYTNGGYQLLATVVQTDPGGDQVAGQIPPSAIQINF